uniref:uncharacterized protein LOC122597618 n=1 Tax=Erigeron canadensis TaxID=72917 RepID=UPI001CB998A2|nr:uncharacterized protein LOC122597618 [Erigeron canadensis]
MIPTRVIHEIEQLMRGFLWSQGSSQKGKSKVAWEVVCLPKAGGLGIRRLQEFNVALLTAHIWNILARKESLWVQWIHVYKIKDRKFWNIPYRRNMTWSWRKILQIRPVVRDLITYSRFGTRLEMGSRLQHGFQIHSNVANLVSGANWAWPVEWIWDTIRTRVMKVQWFDIVWFGRGSAIGNKKSAKTIIAKQVLPAATYYVWQERNTRLFKKEKRPTQQLIKVIEETVRLKLMSFRFKMTCDSEKIFDTWKLPKSLLVTKNQAC